MGPHYCHEIRHRNMIYLDVRTKEEYDEGHIKDALHLDVNEIIRGSDPECKKTDEIVTYCVSGNRSGVAARALTGRGFTHVVNGGGYEDLVRKI